MLSIALSLFHLVSYITLCIRAEALKKTHEVHERRSEQTSWVREARVPGHIYITVKIGLNQKNLDLGHLMLMDISDPVSRNYAKYYTMEHLDDLFAPPDDDRQIISDWLTSEHIDLADSAWTANKQWIHFNANVSTVEKLLKAEYYFYRHTKTGDSSIACENYSIPRDIKHLVDYIKPGVVLNHISRRRQMPTNPFKRDSGKLESGELENEEGQKLTPNEKNCTKLVTVDCFRTLYNITDDVQRQPGNALGIFATGPAPPNKDDLSLYFQQFAPRIPSGTYPIVDRIDGAPDPLKNQNVSKLLFPELTMDFEIAYPFVWPDDLVLYTVDDRNYQQKWLTAGPYAENRGHVNDWLDALDGSYCNRTAFGITGNLPSIDPDYPDPHPGPGNYKRSLQCGRFQAASVLVASFTADEIEFPANYLRRQCSEWMKLGLNGTTVVFGSGDNGVATSLVDKCAGPTHKAFDPTAYGACPYVLSAGGTLLVQDDHEIALTANTANGFLSGGGFSNVFPRPSYQESAVQTYFTEHDPPYDYYESTYHSKINQTGRYNRIGRGMPDVSSIGRHIAVYFNGEFSSDGGGTSASGPLLAALFTRINNARLFIGKKPVGFVHPVLYAHPEVFNDIVEGDNPGCGTNGFKAVPGWDPVTGLGSPNYGKMKELFLSLP